MTGSVLIGRVKLKCAEVTDDWTNNWYSIFDDDGKAAGEVELGLKMTKNNIAPKVTPVTTSAVAFANPTVAAMPSPAHSAPSMYTYAVAANAITSAAPAPAAVAAPSTQFSAISGFTSTGPTVPAMSTPMPQTSGISGFTTPATTGVAYATPSKDHQVAQAAAQPAVVAPAQVVDPASISHITGFSTSTPAAITSGAQAAVPAPSAPAAAPQPSAPVAPIVTGQPMQQQAQVVQAQPQMAYGQPPSPHAAQGAVYGQQAAMQYGQQPAMQYGQQPMGVQYASAAPVQYGAPAAAGVYYAQPVAAQPYGVQPVYAQAQPYGGPQPVVYGASAVPQQQAYGAPGGVVPTQYYGQTSGYGQASGYGQPSAYGAAPAPVAASNPYVNTYLGQAAAPRAPGSLPPGWEERHTPEGKSFYVDHNTKSTSWTRPAF